MADETQLSLADLVRNRTMSPAIAATLATAGEERRSLLVAAAPRLAGKTTTLMATLAHAPAGTAIHQLSEEHGADLGIPAEPDGGYLVMAEIAQTPFPHYLWGEPVRAVFRALRRGFSLATALHAEGVREAFEVVAANDVPDDDAAQLDLMVYIRSLGPDWRAPERRVVQAVYEIEDVVRGEPRVRELHRWDEAADRFIDEERPRRVGSGGDGLSRHLRTFSAL